MCRSRSALLRVGDVLASLFLITPLILLWWSGTWKLLDLYLMPLHRDVSSWISLAFGSFVSIVGYYVMELLKDVVTAECSAKHVLVSRIFIYVYASGVLNYWRGVWYLSDDVIGKDWKTSLISFVVSHLLLVVFRGSRNSIGPPFSVMLDHRPNFYESAPRYRSEIVSSFDM